MTVDRPFPMTVRYELTEHPDGTTVAVHVTGTPGRFFWWATPLMARQVRTSITGDSKDCAPASSPRDHKWLAQSAGVPQ